MQRLRTSAPPRAALPECAYLRPLSSELQADDAKSWDATYRAVGCAAAAEHIIAVEVPGVPEVQPAAGERSDRICRVGIVRDGSGVVLLDALPHGGAANLF